MIRVVLVGTPNERDRLRSSLPDVVEIAGEAPTIGSARQGGFDADAWLLAARPARFTSLDEDAVEVLTPREDQVLALLTEGLSNRAIAARLSISDQTVKFHVASICGKLGAVNRTDAVRRAARRGLVSL